MKLNQTKITYYAMAYITNINYLIILVLLTYNRIEPLENPLIPMLHFIIPASISMLISAFVIRNSLENNLDITKTIIRLAIIHSIALGGLVFSFLSIF
ncbi:MAG: hypothetical protein ACNA7U_00440 [Candidatus Izemoplasmataceae bacterium]